MKKLLLPLLILLSFSDFVHAQKLIQAHKVTYDEQLRPVLIVDLNNKLKKKVTHIVYKFLMTDMSGWEDTSTSRYLKEQSTTRITRVVNLPSGYKMRDSFLVPQLNQGATDAPTRIGIDYIRYSDGTIDKTVAN
ncbi:hypothetical protein [Pedobacter sp. Leaf170]|uniref:hypothetical protein n=1 Tax=Pedobacter sp. Leaf170 TaxID=2876558 RepID=UPI001E647145|nr:hypothetical protein [Pedobacter sp. Leaf170]